MNEHEAERIKQCQLWWEKIESQLNNDNARVYIPDICIAETVKVLHKKYYVDKWYSNWSQFDRFYKKFTTDIRLSHKDLIKKKRTIRYHDIPASRDILISIGRFYRNFSKNGNSAVSIPDLIIVATAKYLIDFYDIPYKCIHIITLDRVLRRGISEIPEIPSAYDPTLKAHSVDKIFK